MDSKKAFELLKNTQEKAYAPYSNFKVGSLIRSQKSGKIYKGCNYENASFGATICAERNAVGTMIAEEGPEVKVDFVAVLSPKDDKIAPCGMCLQVLAEFVADGCDVLLLDQKGEGVRSKFSEFLPSTFEQEDLA